MAAILTLVTNARGSGPGHSAVSIGSTVYSFEDWVSILVPFVSGWNTLGLTEYISNNAHRPFIISQLNGSVSEDKILRYVAFTRALSAGYLRSAAVCSTMVANAVNSAISGSFDPDGMDTPWGVYQLAHSMGLVTSETVHWSGRGSLSQGVQDSILEKLRVDYPAVYAMV